MNDTNGKRVDEGRRKALKGTVGLLGGAAGLLFSGSAAAQAIGAACGLTPEQPEGPFYPVEDQADKNVDLTRVKGRLGRARGEVIYIEGVVSDDECRPVGGALVEIWQACASGRYNHPSDPNPAELDPNFQYWGQAVTDAQGHYRFKTILPGAYPAGGGWMRPPHIHFKVHRRGYLELVTQLYFEGDPLNGRDHILRRLDPAERARVVVPLLPAGEGLERGSRIGRFDIALRSAF